MPHSFCLSALLTGKDVADRWYDEVKKYNFSHPGFSSGTGEIHTCGSPPHVLSLFLSVSVYLSLALLHSVVFCWLVVTFTL